MKSIFDNPTHPFYYNNSALTGLDKLIEVVILGKIIWALINLVAIRLLRTSLAARRITATKSDRERSFALSRGCGIGCRAVVIRLHLGALSASTPPKEAAFFCIGPRT
jgi:hypothetical protein